MSTWMVPVFLGALTFGLILGLGVATLIACLTEPSEKGSNHHENQVA